MLFPRVTVLALLYSMIAGCASGGSPTEVEHRIALAEYEAGNYVAAERELRDALGAIGEWPLPEPSELSDEGRRHARLLANVYWESGQDYRVLKVAASLGDGVGLLWECKVAERRRFYAPARQCYKNADEPERLRRVIRREELGFSLSSRGHALSSLGSASSAAQRLR